MFKRFTGGSSGSGEKDKKNEKIGSYLKNVPLLSRLTDEERAVLGGALKERMFKPGKDIIIQGQEGKDFFILKSVRFTLFGLLNC
jgi:hypothetical protein